MAASRLLAATAASLPVRRRLRISPIDLGVPVKVASTVPPGCVTPDTGSIGVVGASCAAAWPPSSSGDGAGFFGFRAAFKGAAASLTCSAVMAPSPANSLARFIA